MRRGGHMRGVTLVEFLAASSIATVVGGAMILLMTGVRDVSQTHMTFNQLSGYLEATATVLQRDIWSAVNVCQEGVPNPGDNCPGATDEETWLALDIVPPGGAPGWQNGPDVKYKIEGTNLERRVWNDATASWGAPWNIAQFVDPAATIAQINPLVDDDSNPGTPPVAQPGLIRIQLQVSRTVNGRPHIRTDTFDCRYQIP